MKLISSTYTRFIAENKDNIQCNKKGLFCTTFQINILPRILVSAKRVLYNVAHIFKKINRGIVQKPGIWDRTDLEDDYC